uniref:Uncharacterized protein n=1 Tax=Anguilla anguilla TaxID=7936 RepID=A0A0E9TFU6_ANGAN
MPCHHRRHPLQRPHAECAKIANVFRNVLNMLHSIRAR